MKKIDLKGLSYIERLDGSDEWYWASDYCHGDLYEAEELFEAGHSIKSNRLLFVEYPSGKVVEPIPPLEGQYFGRPLFFEHSIIILLVDFAADIIWIKKYDVQTENIEVLASLKRSEIKSCYNLILRKSPLFLSREDGDGKYQILWPQQASFQLEDTETIFLREEDKLYSTVWFEDPDYREETIVRRYPSGEVLEQVKGSLIQMPDGQKWLLQ